MYKYPESLVDYLTDRSSEGCEIFTSYGADSTIWIIKEVALGEWIVLVEWYEGCEDYSCINITGAAFDRLHKVMIELKEETSE